MTWRLIRVVNGKAHTVEVFDTAGRAANWIAEIEGYAVDGVFFQVMLGAAHETDEDALNFLNHKPLNREHSYVLQKIVQ